MGSAVDAPWMRAPATRAVIEALSAGGAEVRFVGGCVRDALLGRENADIDIGTPDEPARVLALLERAGIETRTVPRGIAHGTVTALAGGMRYEITTLRRDVATDGRHAEVAFSDDWREDAARRDFTINAMSAAPDGALHDYFNGREDLEAGRVRFVGDPARRIAEDHLRILRFFRFFAWYGKGEPDEAALAACKGAAHTIPSLSGERVQTEMLKLLTAENPVPAVRAMWSIGVLAVLLPEGQRIERLESLVGIESLRAEADPVRRLAVLIDGSNDATAVAARWRLTADETRRLAALCDLRTAFNREHTPHERRVQLYRLGSARFRDLQLLAWVFQDDIESETAHQEIMEAATAWEPPTFPVHGADVLALGVEEGPKVGGLLREVEEWWIENDFAPDRAAMLEKLDALIAESRDQ